MANNGRFEFTANGRSKIDLGVFFAGCTLILALAVLAFTEQSRITDLKIQNAKLESQLENEKVRNAILRTREEETKTITSGR